MTTPIYQLPYLVEGEWAGNVRPKMQALAEKIDAALAQQGVAAPNASTLALQAGRITSLEESRWRRFRAHMAGDWTYAGGDVFLTNFTTVQWDAGSATVNAADRMFTTGGAPTIKKAGLYRLRSRLSLNGGQAGSPVAYRLSSSTSVQTSYGSDSRSIITGETHLDIDVEVPLAVNARVYPLVWASGSPLPTFRASVFGHVSYLDIQYVGPTPTNPTTR